MAKNKLDMVAVKKTSAGKKIVKAIAVIAAVNGTVKLISMYCSRNNNSKNLSEGEYCYKLMMDGKQIKFTDQVVKKITLSARMSGIDLDLSDMEDINGLRISCKGWMSGISIRVPENVTVKTNLKLRTGSISNSVPAYIDEDLPTIYISGKMYLSGVIIRVAEEPK